MKLDDLVQGHPEAEKTHYDILKEAFEKCGVGFAEDKTNGGLKFIRVSNHHNSCSVDFDFGFEGGFLKIDH